MNPIKSRLKFLKMIGLLASGEYVPGEKEKQAFYDNVLSEAAKELFATLPRKELVCSDEQAKSELKCALVTMYNPVIEDK